MFSFYFAGINCSIRLH